MIAASLGISTTALAMCIAGIAVFAIAIASAKRDIVNVSFAVPLAMFGALHLFGPQFVKSLVPAYMPARMFWVDFVGLALIAASVSIASNVAVRWSGLLFGIMMFVFVATIHLPGAVARPHDRIIWTVVFREMSFGGAGLILAGYASAGRPLVTLAMIVFGVEHFLHPTGLPGVPLVKQMPAWVPARVLIDYVTGAALLVTAASVVFKGRTRLLAGCTGGWLLLLVLLIYGPVLITALSSPNTSIEVEGLNYFADTMLFAAAILTLARDRSR